MPLTLKDAINMSLTLGFDFRLLAFSGFGDPGLFPVKVLALDLRIVLKDS